MSKSLQEITDAWGKWMDKKYNGGGVNYTASTDYQEHSSLNDYHKHEVRVEGTELSYDPYAPSPKPGFVSSASTSYENDSSVEQEVTFKQSVSTSQTFSWSVTEELDIGLSVEVKAGLPAVAQVTTTMSAEFDLSSTQGDSKTDTQEWSVDQPIRTPAHTHINAKMLVNTEEYDIKWGAKTTLKGYVAIWFNNKVSLHNNRGAHHLWFINIGNVFRNCRDNKIIDIKGYEIVGNKVIANSYGVFKGGQGVGIDVKVTEKPLTKGATSRDYTIHLDLDKEPTSLHG